MSFNKSETSVWKQDFDFESKDYGDLGRIELLRVFREMDWEGQRHEFFKDYSNNCPPGFGITAGKRFFHLYVTGSDLWALRVELPATKRIFGIIPKPSKVVYAQVSNLEWAEKAILLFFDGQDDELIAMCSECADAEENNPLNFL